MTTYVTHTCRNKQCQRAFMDVDPIGTARRDFPISARYCPTCINNGHKQPVKKALPEALLAHKFKKREASNENS